MSVKPFLLFSIVIELLLILLNQSGNCFSHVSFRLHSCRGIIVYINVEDKDISLAFLVMLLYFWICKRSCLYAFNLSWTFLLLRVDIILLGQLT
jgi:hypothetical protein